MENLYLSQINHNMLDFIDLQKEIDLVKFIIPKIAVSTICGLIVGFEREIKNKVAGLRTIVLICVGSTIFTAAALMTTSHQSSDPGRVISTIVTGIGFLGGGVIVKNEDKIIGVTTAAFIWVVAAIGILCGLGSILMPMIVTIGLLFVSILFEKLEGFIRKLKK